MNSEKSNEIESEDRDQLTYPGSHLIRQEHSTFVFGDEQDVVDLCRTQQHGLVDEYWLT